MKKNSNLVCQVKIYLTQDELDWLDSFTKAKYGRVNRSPYLRKLLVKKIQKVQRKANERQVSSSYGTWSASDDETAFIEANQGLT
tara:strand:- start:57 stop:311 length:255 start_codon:yes stop_codon:yes gene_type:complete